MFFEYDKFKLYLLILFISVFFFVIKFCFLLIQYIQGPRSSFQSAGGRSTSFEVKLGEGAGGGGGGCGVVDFKNGLPGADSIFFNTVATHQAFF